MTMTKELIDRLRTNANWLDEEDNDERAIRKSMLEAADTIQLLSEKLNALQTEPCEDCISREAALAGLANIAKAKAKSDAQKAMMGRAMFFIERLQYVQPEIIRCCQCKYAEVADPEDSQDGYTCQFHRGSIWFSGSYCSWAERRQDG